MQPDEEVVIDYKRGDPTIYRYGTKIRMKKPDGEFCILECTAQGWKLVEQIEVSD